MKLQVGAEIRFYKWNVDHHDLFRALVRDWNIANHRVDLSYQDGTAKNQAIVKNYEEFGGDDLDENDYWQHAYRVSPALQPSRPFTSPSSPTAGQVVWYFRYVSGDAEHHNHLAVIRNVGAGDPPTLALFYINDSGVRTPVSNITPYGDVTFPSTDDYWARRVLLPA